MSVKADRERIQRQKKILNGFCRVKGCKCKIFLASTCEKHYELKLNSDRKARAKLRESRKKENKCQWCGLDLTLCDRSGLSRCVSCEDQHRDYTFLKGNGF